MPLTPPKAPDFAFPRTHRLTKPAEFTAIFRQCDVKIYRKALRIRARQNRMRVARLGLVVAKRNVPKAHDRNRLKRICREMFRQQPGLPAVDIVLQVQRLTSSRTLREQLESAFQELTLKAQNVTAG